MLLVSYYLTFSIFKMDSLNIQFYKKLSIKYYENKKLSKLKAKYQFAKDL